VQQQPQRRLLLVGRQARALDLARLLQPPPLQLAVQDGKVRRAARVQAALDLRGAVLLALRLALRLLRGRQRVVRREAAWPVGEG
jgi:hypothetical protein